MASRADHAAQPRVLHVIEDLGLGGAEKLLATLLPVLRDRGVDTEVAVLGSRNAFSGPLEEAHVSIHMLNLGSHRSASRALWGLRRVMQEAGCHLVHTHLARANLFGRLAAAANHLPVTTTYHDTDYEPEVYVDNPNLRPWKVALYRLFDRMTLRLCTRVVAVSAFVGLSLERRLAVSRSRVEVIPNGVPAVLEPIDSMRRAAVRANLGLPPHRYVVVQVGRLTPQKGQLHTLRVARELRDQNVTFVLVGGGPLERRIDEEITGTGLQDSVILAGAQSHVEHYLQAADLFLFPSLHEGFGIAAVEAMAAGLPVVTYRHGPLPGIVLHDETGILVDFRDTQALAAAVSDLLAQPLRRARMGEMARRRVRDRFLIGGVADEHVRFYGSLLQNSGSAPRRER